MRLLTSTHGAGSRLRHSRRAMTYGRSRSRRCSRDTCSDRYTSGPGSSGRGRARRSGGRRGGRSSTSLDRRASLAVGVEEALRYAVGGERGTASPRVQRAAPAIFTLDKAANLTVGSDAVEGQASLRVAVASWEVGDDADRRRRRLCKRLHASVGCLSFTIACHDT
jgi:hypothetical protein